jgi:deoxyribodipyrimidine photo-lyase
LSARRALAELRRYEAANGANDSSYWLFVELLWREYFQWIAEQLGDKLFALKGINDNGGFQCFYPERFEKWCQGTTPYPLVNACMRELKQTGFLSNRGRQIVASCLVNELALDWRYGAAWFENQLCDYDVASNWGNWQYIAGVGVDPRGGRHFNLQKQTEMYDPKHEYIERWAPGPVIENLDTRDAADWPLG